MVTLSSSTVSDDGAPVLHHSAPVDRIDRDAHTSTHDYTSGRLPFIIASYAICGGCVGDEGGEWAGLGGNRAEKDDSRSKGACSHGSPPSVSANAVVAVAYVVAVVRLDWSVISSPVPEKGDSGADDSSPIHPLFPTPTSPAPASRPTTCRGGWCTGDEPSRA